jgi:hypothetical protein
VCSLYSSIARKYSANPHAWRRDGHIGSVQRHRNHAIKLDEINELRRSLFAKLVDAC